MTKLHQILAVEADVRNQTQKDLTAAHHGLQKPEMLNGVSRTYQPVKEDGDQLPPEGNLLQTRAADVIRNTQKILAKLFDVTATRDYGNLNAMADLVIDGETLLTGAPATFLLWLEKRLVDVHTFVCKLPVLPADTEWEFDANANAYRNKREIKTHRTLKIEDFKIVTPATPQHPAQIAKVTKDELAGYWTTNKFSGALPADVVAAMKERVERLQKEVKFAREKANQCDVIDQKVGAKILDYVFQGGF